MFLSCSLSRLECESSAAFGSPRWLRRHWRPAGARLLRSRGENGAHRGCHGDSAPLTGARVRSGSARGVEWRRAAEECQWMAAATGSGRRFWAWADELAADTTSILAPRQHRKPLATPRRCPFEHRSPSQPSGAFLRRDARRQGFWA